MQDIELLRETANNFSKEQLISFYQKYYSHIPLEELEPMTAEELRDMFIEGEAR